MRVTFFGFLAAMAWAVAFAALSAQQAGQEKKTDAERIVGTWRLTSAIENGEKAPAEATSFMRVTFTKEGIVDFGFPQIDKEPVPTFRNKLVEPGKVDIGPENLATPGIYNFDGEDRLTLCLPQSPKSKRPTAFTSVAGKNQNLWVLQRVNPNEKMTVEEKAKYDELMRSGLLKVREAAARTQIASNFRQICGALHTYAGQYNSFPSHAIYGKDDKTPLLSWRVAILPFLEQGALYNQFKLDERWDSEHNKKLISRMPQCFALPGAEKEVDGLTFYQVFTGPATVFDGPKKMKWNEITNGDGISNTLLLVHASEPVIWTKPADLLLPQVGGKMPALGGLSKDSTQIAWCDGTTSSIPRSLDPATLRAIVTPNGKEVVDRNKIGK